jgi:hypothetical protein
MFNREFTHVRYFMTERERDDNMKQEPYITYDEK